MFQVIFTVLIFCGLNLVPQFMILIFVACLETTKPTKIRCHGNNPLYSILAPEYNNPKHTRTQYYHYLIVSNRRYTDTGDSTSISDIMELSPKITKH